MSDTISASKALARNTIIDSFLAVSRISLGFRTGQTVHSQIAWRGRFKHGAPAYRVLAALAAVSGSPASLLKLPPAPIRPATAYANSVQADDALIQYEVLRLMNKRVALSGFNVDCAVNRPGSALADPCGQWG